MQKELLSLVKINNDNKMIIVADGDMALNDFSPQQQQILPMGLNKYTVGSHYEYQFANRDFILNCLEYMVNRSLVLWKQGIRILYYGYLIPKK